MPHEDETANFLGDPVNDYCELCLCSYFYSDDECACECHDFDSLEFGDDDDA
jgi:hypothetical protein